MAAAQNRNIAFFLFIFIPAGAFVLSDIVASLKTKIDKDFFIRLKIFSYTFLLLLLVPISLFFLNNYFYKTYDLKQEFGFGYYNNLAPAIDFLQQKKLPQNIFNNFDISGYLMSKTYPSYKVFIDNRPEAYPVNFIESNYLAVFNDDTQRQKVFKKYNIQTVILQLDSGDQGARGLIVLLSKDRTWSLIYLDASVVIFTKNLAIKDIRIDNSIFKKYIKLNTNYLELGKFASNLALIGNLSLAEESLKKADRLNSASCNIKRLYYESYFQTGNMLNANSLKNNYWYCFLYL